MGLRHNTQLEIMHTSRKLGEKRKQTRATKERAALEFESKANGEDCYEV